MAWRCRPPWPGLGLAVSHQHTRSQNSQGPFTHLCRTERGRKSAKETLSPAKTTVLPFHFWSERKGVFLGCLYHKGEGTRFSSLQHQKQTMNNKLRHKKPKRSAAAGVIARVVPRACCAVRGSCFTIHDRPLFRIRVWYERQTTHPHAARASREERRRRGRALPLLAGSRLMAGRRLRRRCCVAYFKGSNKGVFSCARHHSIRQGNDASKRLKGTRNYFGNDSQEFLVLVVLVALFFSYAMYDPARAEVLVGLRAMPQSLRVESAKSSKRSPGKGVRRGIHCEAGFTRPWGV